MSADRDPEPLLVHAEPPGPVRWALVGVGVLLIGAGLWQLVISAPSATHPVAAAAWLAGGLIAHDAVLAPLALVVGAGVSRIPDRRWRRGIAIALAVAVSLVVLAAPSWLRP